MSTKVIEQSRRTLKCQSTEVLFSDDMPVTLQQERFLSNGKNKTRLLNGLTQYMERHGVTVKQSEADADALIVRTAISLSNYQNVVVVGTDVDLLILLLQLYEKKR